MLRNIIKRLSDENKLSAIKNKIYLLFLHRQ